MSEAMIGPALDEFNRYRQQASDGSSMSDLALASAALEFARALLVQHVGNEGTARMFYQIADKAAA